MLEGKGIVVRRGGRVTLDQVDVRVRPGAVTAVVGPNGAGKSTLIAALTGLIRTEAGAVALDGAPLASVGRRSVARRVAVLQQQFRVTFPFRAHEVVAMGREPHLGREPPQATAERVQAAMAAADVLHLADRPVDRLSGGERQRVFLARALAQILPLPADAPRYLLLDEPTASLDLRHQATTLGFARTVARRGAGVLAVLHDLNLAARFADDVLLLDGGAVQAVGAPADVFTEATLRPVYGRDLAIFWDRDGDCPVVLPRDPGPDATIRLDA